MIKKMLGSKKNYITKSRIKTIIDVPKIKTKYVPRKLILDEIREYRSSRIISHISDGVVTCLIKKNCKNMTNDQKNMLRSILAFIISETINKALEKPLKIVDNIKMFIKVGKIIYKVIMYFDEKIKEYRLLEDKITEVINNDSEYLKYLDKHPTIKHLENRMAILDYLGKEVIVKIDKPIGSPHPKYIDLLYQVNYGHLQDTHVLDDEEYGAYIIGINEPIKEFIGIVKAVIIRKNDIEDNLVVCPFDNDFSKEQIKELTDFQEKYFDIEIIM